MKYLLDTNICIYIINSKPAKIVSKFNNYHPGELSISSVSVAELRYGAAKSHATEKNNLALNQFLLPLEIINFDHNTALFYGKLRTQLERKGKPIGPLDTLIAATALAYDLILVTNNMQEFKRIEELKLQNWI